jgi:hypothetical protein
MGSRIEDAARRFIAKPTARSKAALRIAVEEDAATENRKAFVTAAQVHQRRDGELEIDDDAVVSLSDFGGAYVAAWVWVDKEDMESELARSHGVWKSRNPTTKGGE